MIEGIGADLVLAALPKATPEDVYPTEPRTTADQDDQDESGERPSQSSALVAFVRDRAELFHDCNKTVYATDRSTGETRRIDGRPFKDWLVAEFYKAESRAPRDQSVREALVTLSGLGRFDGDEREVWVRVAPHEGAYYLDLAERGRSRAVRITADGWSVVADPPVRFIRPESAQPLPEPECGGDLSRLWDFANVPEDARILVICCLAEWLRPDTPFPVLEILGEQGSAKSTTHKILRRLIDPNACDLRGAPRSAEDVFVAAGASWLVSYENVSHLPAPMQDALCVLATGGGFAKRRLYSDADESVINVKRPVVLNGISAAVTAQDLIDRTISVETPRISRRIEVTTLWGDFEREQGRLLGALLDAMSGALSRLPHTALPDGEQPRLAEFARFGAALAESLGAGAEAFHTQFRESRVESVARTIDASPVASALIDWFEARGRRDEEMSAKDLLREVETRKPQGADAWPRSAKGFADALRRAAPALRTLGIECHSLGKRGGKVLWRVADGGYLSDPRPASPDVLAHAAHRQDVRTFRTSSPELSPADDDTIEVEV